MSDSTGDRRSAFTPEGIFTPETMWRNIELLTGRPFVPSPPKPLSPERLEEQKAADRHARAGEGIVAYFVALDGRFPQEPGRNG